MWGWFLFYFYFILLLFFVLYLYLFSFSLSLLFLTSQSFSKTMPELRPKGLEGGLAKKPLCSAKRQQQIAIFLKIIPQYEAIMQALSGFEAPPELSVDVLDVLFGIINKNEAEEVCACGVYGFLVLSVL
jgi:hypothetical protein